MASASAKIGLDGLRRPAPPAPSEPVSREEIADIVRGVVSTMHGDLSAAHLKLYQELESLAQYIQMVKDEIASLRPSEISERHIPDVADELDAIVRATEIATGTILDCAERIEEVSADSGDEIAERITPPITGIYEACNFQDASRQRIGKVIRALKHIDAKVRTLVAIFGGESDVAVVPEGPVRPAPAGDGGGRTGVLEGPQPPEKASRQDDIDALLARLD